ncbi:MAG TPA: hypothetical protein DCO67_02895 [Staphylococcus sp.]|nr:hypothetical protein [Staphylococcus sp.]
MKTKKDILEDLQIYKNHLKQRKLLIDEMPNEYENYFSIIYISINVLLRVEKYEIISKNEKTFRNKIVENLVKTIDLVNLKYIKDTDKAYRSLIEAFFKLMLEVERVKVHNENKSKGIFDATDELRDLKSISTTQKVSKLTSYTQKYFKNEYPDVVKLNEFYSELSGSVHISDQYKEPLYLLKYDDIDLADINENLNKYKLILNIIFDILIPILEKVYNTSVISRENHIYFKKLLK